VDPVMNGWMTGPATTGTRPKQHASVESYGLWASCVRLLYPDRGLIMFGAALGIGYGILPLLIHLTVIPSPEYLGLALLSTIGVAAMVLGAQVPLLDRRFLPEAHRLDVNGNLLVGATSLVFIAFVVVTMATAPTIPLLSALEGASADILSQERGDFMKGREGAEAALLYVGTILSSTLVPYSIVLMYAWRSTLRHVMAVLFFVFCVSFLQKALFLNLVLPLLAWLAMTNRMPVRIFLPVVVASVLLLALGTYLALGTDAEAGWQLRPGAAEYLSAAHVPSSTFDYLTWRALAVPIFTATDTLLVHERLFGGIPLHGATSSLLSALFELDRINLERFVFEYQFGSWNDIANANSVFLVDGFVNFGHAGTILFGFLVGQVFRLFRLSGDIAFKSLWPLFAFVLLSGPLIGMLLSNGFLYMLVHALFIRVTPPRRIRIA